jgi:hypothetical protein
MAHEGKSNAIRTTAERVFKSDFRAGIRNPQAVFRYTGLRFNTHLFRHAGGKIFLDVRPGHYEVMRRVLGHRSIATTTSIYTGAETRSAGLHFASVIVERRRALENQRSTKKPGKRPGGNS